MQNNSKRIKENNKDLNKNKRTQNSSLLFIAYQTKTMSYIVILFISIRAKTDQFRLSDNQRT